MPKLFDMEESDGNVIVTMPGLVDAEKGYIVGTSRQSFSSMEAAKQGIDAARENMRFQFEMGSLSRYFTKGRKIERVQSEDGTKYRITIPAHYPVTGKTYKISGGAVFEKDTWQEAKSAFLDFLEESGTSKLLTVNVSKDETMAFSDFSKFDPPTLPDQQTFPVPQCVKKYLGFSESGNLHKSEYTYATTIQDKDWEKHLFAFVKDYLAKEGASVKKELDIDRLDYLTPKQAAALSSKIVLDLTKYNHDFPPPGQRSDADGRSALQILQEGRQKNGQADWQGNGVCRNFASTVKAVFESLKANQTSFSRLNNTYCLHVEEKGSIGRRSSSFIPKREEENSFSLKASPGHAWNTFFTVSRTGKIDASIVDVTWVDRNLVGMAQTERLDHTATRMEPIVASIAQNLDRESADYPGQVANISMFYAQRLDNLSRSRGQFAANERAALASRALDFAKHQKDFFQFPEPFVKNVLDAWTTMAEKAEPHEIEAINFVCESSPWVDFNGVLKAYLDKQQLSEYHCRRILFQDDTLQRQVFDILKSRDGFEEAVRNSPAIYRRMLNIYPQLYVRFSPETDPRDAKVFKGMVENSNGLKRHGSSLRDSTVKPDQLQKIVAYARQKLHEADPDFEVDNINHYVLIAHFDTLHKTLVSGERIDRKNEFSHTLEVS
jgi:hypothetical protein